MPRFAAFLLALVVGLSHGWTQMEIGSSPACTSMEKIVTSEATDLACHMPSGNEKESTMEVGNNHNETASNSLLSQLFTAYFHSYETVSKERLIPTIRGSSISIKDSSANKKNNIGLDATIDLLQILPPSDFLAIEHAATTKALEGSLNEGLYVQGDWATEDSAIDSDPWPWTHALTDIAHQLPFRNGPIKLSDWFHAAISLLEVSYLLHILMLLRPLLTHQPKVFCRQLTGVGIEVADLSICLARPLIRGVMSNFFMTLSAMTFVLQCLFSALTTAAFACLCAVHNLQATFDKAKEWKKCALDEFAIMLDNLATSKAMHDKDMALLYEELRVEAERKAEERRQRQLELAEQRRLAQEKRRQERIEAEKRRQEQAKLAEKKRREAAIRAKKGRERKLEEDAKRQEQEQVEAAKRHKEKLKADAKRRQEQAAADAQRQQQQYEANKHRAFLEAQAARQREHEAAELQRQMEEQRCAEGEAERRRQHKAMQEAEAYNRQQRAWEVACRRQEMEAEVHRQAAAAAEAKRRQEAADEARRQHAIAVAEAKRRQEKADQARRQHDIAVAEAKRRQQEAEQSRRLKEQEAAEAKRRQEVEAEAQRQAAAAAAAEAKRIQEEAAERTRCREKKAAAEAKRREEESARVKAERIRQQQEMEQATSRSNTDVKPSIVTSSTEVKVYGLRKDGQPCEACIHQKRYCHHHKDQAPNHHAACQLVGQPPQDTTIDQAIYGRRQDGEPCGTCIRLKGFCHHHKDQAPNHQAPTVFGLRRDGQPCQRCINQGDYCFQHLDQRP